MRTLHVKSLSRAQVGSMPAQSICVLTLSNAILYHCLKRTPDTAKAPTARASAVACLPFLGRDEKWFIHDAPDVQPRFPRAMTFGQVAPAPTPDPTPKPVDQPVSPGPIGGQYGKTYSGDATYYGFSTGGNCAYKGTVAGLYGGMIPSEKSKKGERNVS